jgi:hypothetical protein
MQASLRSKVSYLSDRSGSVDESYVEKETANPDRCELKEGW